MTEPGVQMGPAAVLLKTLTLWIDNLLPWMTSGWFSGVLVFIAILMDLQYYVPWFGWGQLRIIAKEFIVLQIYYCQALGATDTASNPEAFMYSCIFLFVDEVLVYYTARKLALWYTQNMFLQLDRNRLRKRLKKARAQRLKRQPLARPFLDQGVEACETDEAAEKAAQEALKLLEQTVKREDEETAYNVYTDFRQPMRRVFVVFFAQVGLVLYYIFEMSGGDQDTDSPGFKSHDPAQVSFVKWMFAVATIIVAGELESGPPCSFPFWMKQREKFTANVKALSEFPEIHGPGWCGLRRVVWGPRARLVYRFLFDAGINSVARSVIRGTAPIMLCVEGPLDFVKDVTALYFLIKLDDLEENVNLTEVKSWSENIGDPEDAADRLLCSHEEDHVRKLLKFPDSTKLLSLYDEEANGAPAAPKAEEDEEDSQLAGAAP